MISVPLMVGILLTCLTPDMAIPEVWITDKPSLCSCPAPANEKTASCLVKAVTQKIRIVFGLHDKTNNSSGFKKLIKILKS